MRRLEQVGYICSRGRGRLDLASRKEERTSSFDLDWDE